jgi:hypothetical protein
MLYQPSKFGWCSLYCRYVAERTPNWFNTLKECLECTPSAAVGEVFLSLPRPFSLLWFIYIYNIFWRGKKKKKKTWDLGRIHEGICCFLGHMTHLCRFSKLLIKKKGGTLEYWTLISFLTIIGVTIAKNMHFENFLFRLVWTKVHGENRSISRIRFCFTNSLLLNASVSFSLFMGLDVSHPSLSWKPEIHEWVYFWLSFFFSFFSNVRHTRTKGQSESLSYMFRHC